MTIEKCFFAGFPLDPADQKRSDDGWLFKKITDPSSRFLIYVAGRPLMNVADGLMPVFKTTEEVSMITGGNWAKTDWVFIGLDGETAFFAVGLPRKPAVAAHEKFIDLRSVALQVSTQGFSDMPALLGRGKMLLEWQARRHFCSCCGHRTRADHGGYIRKCTNDACGREHFPRTDPVVIMLVVSGDRCLMGRGRDWPEGQYSALAGFMEPGETIEEATRREVWEESGIRVGAVRYLKSQPWPFPSSLMIGVQADALTSEITIDTNELQDAQWFDRTSLLNLLEGGGTENIILPQKIAIARYLLEHWLQHG